MKQHWRILLADDHQLFRDALKSMFQQVPGLEVVAEASNGLDLVKLAQTARADIACVDIGMPEMNGIEATRRLVAACPGIKVIAISAFIEQRYALDMFAAGAAAYVTKSGAGEELMRAISAVQKNQKYVCPQIATVMAGALAEARENHVSQPAQLGARERQVLQLVAEGNTSQEIANQLHIAHSTVEVHRRNIMRKLGLHSVATLTRYAITNGLAPD